MVELVDIYNEEKQKTGRIIDKYGPFNAGEYYLTSHIWIKFRKLWLIQKRSYNRKNNPGKWSVTGGTVKKGETSLQAARRELFEELKIRLPFKQFKFVGCYKQKYSFVDIYIVEASHLYPEIDFNKEEVANIKWCTEEEIISQYKTTELVQSIYSEFQMVKNS